MKVFRASSGTNISYLLVHVDFYSYVSANRTVERVNRTRTHPT
jgi:hypothetical protein